MAGPNEQDRRQRALDGAVARRLRNAVSDRPHEALAAAMGVDVAIVAAYLSGQCRIPAEHLLCLARLLNVPVSTFYGEPPGGAGDRW